MKITATNKATGEVVELPADNPEEIVQAWQIAQEYEKTSKALKDQLKKLVPDIVGDNGLSEPINNFQFRVNAIQRKTYDKTVLRNLVDEDFYDTLVKPDKTLIDILLQKQDPVL